MGEVVSIQGAAEIPVTILTGFLGSGKTTRLNYLLGAPGMEDSAVIINEFGDTPLDQYFADLPEDDVAVLPNGCLCCVARDGLEEALERLTGRQEQRGRPLARIYIETSGLADPAPAAQLVMSTPTSVGTLVLAEIVVTVDAEHIATQLERHSECRKQVALADRILFTKGDRIPRADIDAARLLVRSFNGHAAHFLASSASKAEEELPPIPAGADEEWTGSRPQPQSCGHSHGHDIAAMSIIENDPLDWTEFSRWLRRIRREHGDNLLRLKGVLALSEEGARPVVVDAIHHVAYPPRPLPQAARFDGISRIVLILQGVDCDQIRRSWEEFRRPSHVAAAE